MATKSRAATTEQLQMLLKRGFESLSRGRIHDAGECCRQVLQLKPDLVEGHFLVGLVALEAKDRKTAFSAFGSVTKLQKDHAAAWAQLAKLFMSEGQVTRADAALAEATRSKPSDPLIHDLLGSVYSMMGEHGVARDWFEKAVAARPDHTPYMHNLANNLIYHGETPRAEEIFLRIIELQPNSPQAHWSLAGGRKATDHDHVHRMQALLQDGDHHPRIQAFYYYAIGKELEDLQEWDAAFDAFEKGARARRETVEYDEAAEIALFGFLEEKFTATWLNDGSVGHDSEAPVFVLGQPRSGTTLIERIISSHSAVHSAGELQQFNLSIRRLSNHKDPRRFSVEFLRAALGVNSKRLGATYMDSTARMRGTTPRFVDKLPQNYLLIPLILKALPNAKIIHLTRNPMDACFASFKQLFADAYLHSYDLEEMARHHCRYRHLMDVWRDRFGSRFFDISYEETVSNLEPNARALIAYLGLPWEESCLRFHEQSKAVSTASAVQVREPVHTRSVDRWRRYEAQLQPMQEILTAYGLIPQSGT